MIKKIKQKLTKSKNRLSVSLLEIMICIVIFAMISSIIGIRIDKVMSQYRFDRNSRGILEKLKFAKQLAVTNQSDVEVKFKQKDNKIICEIDFRGIDSKDKNKEIFSQIYFDFKEDERKELKNEITITFSSTGIFAPYGIFRLYLKKNMKKADNQIDLQEYFLKKKLL